MDCKDLMIGDWVNYSILNINSKVVSIIGNHTITIQFVDKNNKVGVIHGLLEETISPIPLTEEILVKNGFERCDYNNKYFIIDDVINLITPKWRGGTEYYACAWYQDEFDDLVQHIEICKCAYVHQLQRLLRLCGIEKELTI